MALAGRTKAIARSINLRAQCAHKGSTRCFAGANGTELRRLHGSAGERCRFDLTMHQNRCYFASDRYGSFPANKRPQGKKPMSFMDLAVVDISPFVNGNPQERASAARAFGRAFETTGFAVIVGHGVSDDLADDVYACLKRFFSQPFEKKAEYTPPEKAKGRGYLPMGIESVAKTLTSETPPDLCEALVFSGPHRELRGSPSRNIWPDYPAELAPLVREWTVEIEKLTAHLSRISALALDLPEDYLQQPFADPAITLRFVNYPDQPTPPAPGQLRYGAHHDYGGLTILRQDSAPGGLQICDRDGVWREAGNIPGSFVINVGDLMARWTNNRWRSTLHRVSNPDRSLTGSTQRLSMVAFTGPNEEHVVTSLPSCVSEESPSLFEPVIAGEYIRAKIRASMELTPAE